MGLETYQTVLIVVAVVLVAAMILALIKKRRHAKKNQTEIRTVSTIQSVYYEPAKYTQYPINPTCPNSSAPGWHLTNLDGPTSTVNIRQPSSSGVVVQRDPVVLTQTGYPPYPVYEPSTIQQQAYGKPPPYNPAFQHSSNTPQ